ncbi:MAG TPA: alpha-galactosidase [Erysipelotrichaceae bacterium]|nr:alpha-galactosidase [Erysipelotrichaceae bacterium]
MPIHYHENTRTFHLFNASVSYIFTILENGTPGSLYYGARLTDKDDYSELLEMKRRANAPCTYEGNLLFSLEHLKQEYPLYGHGDLRYPACSMRRENGSHIFEFRYISHVIYSGKHGINGLPAIWCSTTDEMESLEVELEDANSGTRLTLYYTICSDLPVIARHTRITQAGASAVTIERVMSCNVDLIDDAWEMVQLNGAWSRERHVTTMPLRPGIQSVYSMRGHSSAQFNPFLALKRKECTETQGECMGFTLLYSGSFLAGVEVDNYHVSRVQIGIHPDCFEWTLQQGESFETPEAVYVYSEDGLNGMSQAFHTLFNRHLVRGKYRMKERPILINNWEATYFDFDEEKIVRIAETAAQAGIELFVLDDGWFGNRNDDHRGLGDWYVNLQKLPHGISGLSQRIHSLGMQFGLWIEPEMVNRDSNLYRTHPEWVMVDPDYVPCHGRNQYVLDFSRKEVVDYIFKCLDQVLDGADVNYIKWDMNRTMSEVYSRSHSSLQQGRVMHEYILGVYDLYERLIQKYPDILFESCASGGGRFDAGMLYYAPQAWTSDNSDAVERLKIQYGTSYVYPPSCMGAHVSAVPNHQVFRNTPFNTRANTAFYGAFGYELDLSKLTEDELEQVRQQVTFMKKYRSVFQYGTFYRLSSPFESNETVWMSVSQDQKTAIVGYYRVLNEVNVGYRRIRLKGLNPDEQYRISMDGRWIEGRELMKAGLVTSDYTSGENGEIYNGSNGDFISRLYVLEA